MLDVFIVIDYNFDVPGDISIPCVFSSLEQAFKYALEDVLSKEGKNILVHNYEIEDYVYTKNRISNNNSLGSDWGITYNSKWGNYPCSRIIMQRTIK